MGKGNGKGKSEEKGKGKGKGKSKEMGKGITCVAALKASMQLNFEFAKVREKGKGMVREK